MGSHIITVAFVDVCTVINFRRRAMIRGLPIESTARKAESSLAVGHELEMVSGVGVDLPSYLQEG